MTNCNPPEPIGKSPRKQAIEKLIEKSDDEKRVIPAFVVSPACNHDPMRGRIELVATPPYSDRPDCLGPCYLSCAHCGELLGMIGPIGSTLDVA